MLTRTDRRRFPILIAAIAVLALAGAALGLLFSTAEAQEAETLLSNLEEGAFSTGIVVSDLVIAQEFTTGSNSNGYVLSNVKLDVDEVPNTSADVTVELWSVTTNDPPGPAASVATLTHSTGTWATGPNTFNAPADTELGRRHDLLRFRVLQRRPPHFGYVRNKANLWR